MPSIQCETCGKVHTEREDRLSLLARRLSYQFKARIQVLIDTGRFEPLDKYEIWKLADSLADDAARSADIVFDDYVKGRKRKAV